MNGLRAREQWVSPPVVPREAPAPWIAVWRFRAVALVALALLVWLFYLLYQQLSGAQAQDPGVDALVAALSAVTGGPQP